MKDIRAKIHALLSSTDRTVVTEVFFTIDMPQVVWLLDGYDYDVRCISVLKVEVKIYLKR
jgi:hypothetical protein